MTVNVADIWWQITCTASEIRQWLRRIHRQLQGEE